MGNTVRWAKAASPLVACGTQSKPEFEILCGWLESAKALVDAKATVRDIEEDMANLIYWMDEARGTPRQAASLCRPIKELIAALPKGNRSLADQAFDLATAYRDSLPPKTQGGSANMRVGPYCSRCGAAAEWSTFTFTEAADDGTASDVNFCFSCCQFFT